MRRSRHRVIFADVAQHALQPLGARCSAVAHGDPDDPDALPWVAFTGGAPAPAELVALAEELPFPVELAADGRDPSGTQPAVWLLRAGFVLDPAATSVEVLVGEVGCTSGRGAAGNTAEPVVEVTDTEVRIAVATYVRKGPQTCPGHPLAPLVVDLGQPVGARTLVDVNGALDDASAPPQERWGDVQVPLAAPSS